MSDKASQYRVLDKFSDADPVVSNTPWEVHQLNGHNIHVKREDLSCPLPGPQFSKIRGLYTHLLKVRDEQGPVPIGILDTIHSKAGWGTAYIGNALGMEVFDFFPIYKGSIGNGYIPYQQLMAASLGAALVPMKATAGYILKPLADKLFEKYTHGAGHMLPVGLKLETTIAGTYDEVSKYTPDELMYDGTWIISTSSATIAAGVWKALSEVGSEVKLLCHSGYSRKQSQVESYIKSMSGYEVDKYFQFIDDGYEYKDKVDVPCPFPCNPYYDLKAWKWLGEQNLNSFKQPIVFWNIGA